MRILISNDDGIMAPGIRTLTKAFADAGHEVTVIAPDGQRSAASHSMTLFAPLRAVAMDVPGAVKAYAVSGTPVDCVKLGLKNLCPDAEYVISGINHGYNAGSDVLYSGTVGAAMEGILNDRPAMAVSLAPEREDTYHLAAQLAVEAFNMTLAHPLPKNTLLNVNYPGVDRALGVKAAPLASTRYLDHYAIEEQADGSLKCTVSGGVDKAFEHGDDDFSWLLAGYATLTVLTPDMSDHEATREVTKIL